MASRLSIVLCLLGLSLAIQFPGTRSHSRRLLSSDNDEGYSAENELEKLSTKMKALEAVVQAKKDPTDENISDAEKAVEKAKMLGLPLSEIGSLMDDLDELKTQHTKGDNIGSSSSSLAESVAKKAETSASCKDTKDKCEAWASDGRCSDEDFGAMMKELCALSCGMCSKASVEERTLDKSSETEKYEFEDSEAKPGSTTKEDQDCITSQKDTSPKCSQWKDKGLCESETFGEQMKLTCPKSCGVCAKPGKNHTLSCVDKDPLQCSKWKSQGLCTESPTVMQSCRKSCDLCDSSSTTKNGAAKEEENALETGSPSKTETSSSEIECMDLSDRCPDWQTDGNCEGHYAEMIKKKCPKSCGLCEGEKEEQTEKKLDGGIIEDAVTVDAVKALVAQPDCIDQKEDCTRWKEEGECDGTQADYMKEKCPRACGLCTDSADSEESSPEPDSTPKNTTTTAETECVDQNPKCPEWHKIGECDGEYAEKMATMCPKSCGLCKSSSSTTTDKTEEKADTKCVDKSTMCKLLVQDGKCESEPSGEEDIKEKCPASCGLCTTDSDGGDGEGGEGKSVEQKVAAETKETEDCKDKSENCEQWKEDGECDSNLAEKMRAQCPKSCGVCISKDSPSVKKTNCTDRDEMCVHWKANGECDGNDKKYMEKKCPLSCGICKPEGDIEHADSAPGQSNSTSADCVDSESSCESWKEQGECDGKFAEQMKKDCPKTCGYCTDDSESENGEKEKKSGGLAGLAGNLLSSVAEGLKESVMEIAGRREDKKCVDYDAECETWEEAGECESSKAEVMKEKCPKSCGVCKGETDDMARRRASRDDYYNNGDDIQDEDSTESVEAAKNDLSSNAIEADDAAIDLPDEDKYYETERSTTATTMSEDSMRKEESMMIADRTKYEFDHHSQEEDLFNKRGEAKATESTIDSRPLNDFGEERFAGSSDKWTEGSDGRYNDNLMEELGRSSKTFEGGDGMYTDSQQDITSATTTEENAGSSSKKASKRSIFPFWSIMTLLVVSGVFYAAYVKRDILIQTVSDRIFRGPQPRSLSFVVTGARSAANAASTAENLMSKPEFGSNEKDSWDWDDAPTSWRKPTDQRQSDIEDPFGARDKSKVTVGDKFGRGQAAEIETEPTTDDADWDSGADASQRGIADTKSAGPKKTLKLSKSRGMKTGTPSSKTGLSLKSGRGTSTSGGADSSTRPSSQASQLQDSTRDRIDDWDVDLRNSGASDWDKDFDSNFKGDSESTKSM